ncbi:hypothetical protein HanRHA438_Chr01g0019871 [Helianthus annuus]|uniref:Uncharacterized protein n=1 Tax=Helianthus annuus TaxID=4232 RepID=A0A251VMW6_HELAN|nr:hypothetical protein HanXRQr2_Chr01g0019351 [Helianthus annuus]KAJ0611434.1 hypothetical protein HanHA300_Chr01g0015761 [Helianthus annuus]KAJ0626730.1 hypothetical protein HanHA89_Chr01g0017351 [Helianthus annuus]KAJ0783079.1 hypothetical protein HanLR1_Chr01g0016301 [Helianthus annuus]KAJ0947781.1 hypothetical protein HanRHA438_Chr01g0019871 [Helianthus annuus]
MKHDSFFFHISSFSVASVSKCLSVYAYIDLNMVFKKMNIGDFELGDYLGMD